MRKRHILLASLGWLGAIVLGTGVRGPLATRAEGGQTPNGVMPFVVVELFTSEGCSSCPPADELLGEIAQDARKTGKPIYALSFHVDYWNYIGWTDPYSKKAFSARQRQYAEAFGTSQIYTPQMVVNGREAFVGSNRRRLERAIQAGLGSLPSHPITIALARVPDGPSTFSYVVSELPGEAVLHLAVVERNVSQNVKRGENSGRTLSHENVVRYFETVADEKGRFSFELPKDARQENCSVVAYIQRRSDMQILAAAQVDL